MHVGPIRNRNWKDLSGKTFTSEARVVSWLAKNAGLDTIETVLVDQDHDDWNAAVKAPDINEGNRQIAHGVNRVLRPIDL